MSKEMKNMEQLFQSKLDENPANSSFDKEWLKLDQQLESNAFFKFKWNRFNIHYLATLLVAVGMAGSALYFALFPTQYHHIRYIVRTDTVFVTGKEMSNERLAPQTATLLPTNNPAKKNASATSVEPQPSQQEALDIPENNHEAHGNPSAPTEVTPPLVQTAKPSVIHYKQDTILKYDSIKVSKRQWRKMKKQ